MYAVHVWKLKTCLKHSIHFLNELLGSGVGAEVVTTITRTLP